MSVETMRLAREGFAAWQRGDFETLEAMLDPSVQWRASVPGEWDCHSRADVMDVIKERYRQGFGGPDTVIVVAHPAAVGGDEWPKEVATVITFGDGKVTDMQDYRTRQEALTAAQ